MNFLREEPVNRSSMVCLNKELNKSSLFGCSDMLMVIYEYLNIKEKLNLIKSISLVKDSLSEYHVKYINNVNNILNVLIRSSVPIYANAIVGIVYSEHLEISKMEEIPVEYKNFIKIMDELSIGQFDRGLILIHTENIIYELNDSRKRRSKAAALMYVHKTGGANLFPPPPHSTLCFVNDINYRNKEKKYFLSERFELFEPDPHYDYNIEDLDLLTFNEGIKRLLETY